MFENIVTVLKWQARYYAANEEQHEKWHRCCTDIGGSRLPIGGLAGFAGIGDDHANGNHIFDLKSDYR